ncbi:MAG: type II toxin-antitoxin system HicA family toxin [Burkholderiales bacterium]|nr:type II toxin-antitoxin system HicA family toxin [Burkholderiales bacterium]
MPKLPRVSGAEAQRALERLGFQKVRQSGSHVIMKRDAKGCILPMHDELKVGTLAGILRQAEVAPEEFVQALQRHR